MSRNIKVTWWFQKHVPVETGMWKMKHCYVCNHFKIFMIKKKKKLDLLRMFPSPWKEVVSSSRLHPGFSCIWRKKPQREQSWICFHPLLSPSPHFLTHINWVTLEKCTVSTALAIGFGTFSTVSFYCHWGLFASLMRCGNHQECGRCTQLFWRCFYFHDLNYRAVINASRLGFHPSVSLRFLSEPGWCVFLVRIMTVTSSHKPETLASKPCAGFNIWMFFFCFWQPEVYLQSVSITLQDVITEELKG